MCIFFPDKAVTVQLWQFYIADVLGVDLLLLCACWRRPWIPLLAVFADEKGEHLSMLQLLWTTPMIWRGQDVSSVEFWISHHLLSRPCHPQSHHELPPHL